MAERIRGNMRKSFIPILISCLLLIPLASIAQQSVTSASGYVVDPANGEPVPYANVLFADSQIGTIPVSESYKDKFYLALGM